MPLQSGDAPSPEVVAAEEAAIQRYAITIVDIRSMQSAIATLWQQEISMMLPHPEDDSNGIVNFGGMGPVLRVYLSVQYRQTHCSIHFQV